MGGWNGELNSNICWCWKLHNIFARQIWLWSTQECKEVWRHRDDRKRDCPVRSCSKQVTKHAILPHPLWQVLIKYEDYCKCSISWRKKTKHLNEEQGKVWIPSQKDTFPDTDMLYKFVRKIGTESLWRPNIIFWYLHDAKSYTSKLFSWMVKQNSIYFKAQWSRRMSELFIDLIPSSPPHTGHFCSAWFSDVASSKDDGEVEWGQIII